MSRPKDRLCRVCQEPCCGHTCRECFQTKNNKIAGNYAKKFDTYKNKNRWTGEWSEENVQ